MKGSGVCRDLKKDLAMWTISVRMGVAGRLGDGQRLTMEIKAQLPCSLASLLEERLYHSEVCLVVIQWTFLRAVARWDLILEVRTLCMLAVLMATSGCGLKDGEEGGEEVQGRGCFQGIMVELAQGLSGVGTKEGKSGEGLKHRRGQRAANGNAAKS